MRTQPVHLGHVDGNATCGYRGRRECHAGPALYYDLMLSFSDDFLAERENGDLPLYAQSVNWLFVYRPAYLSIQVVVFQGGFDPRRGRRSRYPPRLPPT